jgi:hypothetical protein
VGNVLKESAKRYRLAAAEKEAGVEDELLDGEFVAALSA